MKEIFFSPEFIDQEKKRLEEVDQDDTEAKILQLLAETYGGINVARYLSWNAEKLIKERSSAQDEIQ